MANDGEYDVKADVDGNGVVDVKDAEEIMKNVLRASHWLGA